MPVEKFLMNQNHPKRCQKSQVLRGFREENYTNSWNLMESIQKNAYPRSFCHSPRYFGHFLLTVETSRTCNLIWCHDDVINTRYIGYLTRIEYFHFDTRKWSASMCDLLRPFRQKSSTKGSGAYRSRAKIVLKTIMISLTGTDFMFFLTTHRLLQSYSKSSQGPLPIS
jgi:hypothetical protein